VISVDNKVAQVLEKETKVTIDDWYDRVEQEPDLLRVRLTREERCAHLPEMFSDIISRLRNPLPLGTRALTSDTAHEHGTLRREQGYSPAMVVAESRMLQVAIFQTLQFHLQDVDARVLLLDVMAIADEVDSQLGQAMTSYVAEAKSSGAIPAA
jgi:hypothetical protein